MNNASCFDCVILQMTLWCRSQSSALPPCATLLEESTLWKEKLGTSTPVHSAPVTVAECCVRQRCVHRCSARTPPGPRTPAARSAQVIAAAPGHLLGREGCSCGLHPQDPAACQTQEPRQKHLAACFLNSFSSLKYQLCWIHSQIGLHTM